MWKVEFSAEVEADVTAAADWYEQKRTGLGREFVEELIKVWRSLALNPMLGARKHPTKNLRWRYPERFPYRVIYETDEAAQTLVIVAVVHAARHDVIWRQRLE